LSCFDAAYELQVTLRKTVVQALHLYHDGQSDLAVCAVTGEMEKVYAINHYHQIAHGLPFEWGNEKVRYRSPLNFHSVESHVITCAGF
jgi:hypothetical protein